jgi:hypothetical protein
VIRFGLRRILLGLAVAIAVLAPSPVAAHQVAAPEPPPPTSLAPDEDRAPLVPVPVGCSSPEPADVAFVGLAVAKDFEKVRYEIVQLRAGSATGNAIDGLVDVLYLEDAKFLDVGEEYLVGARFDPEYGQLFSTVRPPEPLFGGNDVIGLDDTDTDCPVIDDPVRTLKTDGSSVDSGVLSPLFDDKRTLLATLGVPSAIAFGVILALVLLRYVWGFALKGIFELGRAAVTPAVDHRAIRVRAHRHDDPK